MLDYDDKINFGKHKGETIRHILDIDPKYLMWAVDNISWLGVSDDVMDDIKLAKRVLGERRERRDLQEAFEMSVPKQSSITQVRFLRNIFEYDFPYHEDNFLDLDTGYDYESEREEEKESSSYTGSYGSLGGGDEYGCETTGWGSCGDRSCSSCYPENNGKVSYGEDCSDDEDSRQW